MDPPNLDFAFFLDALVNIPPCGNIWNVSTDWLLSRVSTEF